MAVIKIVPMPGPSGSGSGGGSSLSIGNDTTKVSVLPELNSVEIQTVNGESEISWAFAPDGVIYGPAMGGVKVPAILGVPGQGLYVGTTEPGDVVVIGGDSGQYIGDDSDTLNQIATIRDVGVETSFVVNGGTTGTQPTFDGDPLFSGSYIRMSSNLVHFQIQVDMDNITSFGTGQYYVDLPFPAKYGYKFREGCLHDISAGIDYAIGGHVSAGESRLMLTSTDAQGNSSFDIPFVFNNPVTLNAADNFHISGSYIAEENI